MAGWTARTESGATYAYDSGIVTIHHRDGTSVFQVWVMRSALEPTVLPWNERNFWRDVDVPVIGERLYVKGRDEWRISTRVEEVTTQ